MNAVHERLQRLLEDERTRKAAARVGRAWQESGDDAQLERALDAIETHLAELVKTAETARRDQEQAERKRQALRDEANQRVRTLIEMRVPSEALSELLEDVAEERFEQAFKRADQIEQTLAKIRQGEPGLKMLWRGVWDPEVEYQPGDSVKDEGLAFVCLAKTLDRPNIEQVSPWMPLVDPRRLAAYVPVSGGGGGSSSSSSTFQNLFVQPTAPVTSLTTYLWVQTEIGANDDFTFWIEDGL